MSELEEIFLEKYFLEPGSAGAIGSIYVDDEELIDILGADDLADLQRAFVSILPHITTMRSYLGGDFRPIPGQNPDYLRILIFVCWMQTSKTRKRGDRDFREMLARHTGHRFLGASMRGLNPMWEHLQAYLSKEHGIELDLPAIYPHSQIGRTLRIAFPTWRDKVVFRRLRQGLGQARLLDPLEVSRALYTSRRLLTDTMPSFGYNFGLFDRSWKRGGRDYMKTPFWQAWYSVVAERTALEELEIVKGDFGDHEIFRVSPSGGRRPLRDPEEASKFVPEPIAKAIRGGAVLMEDLGFGRSRATSSMESNLFLMHRSRLAECDEGAVVSYDNVNAQWILANFRSSTASDAPVKSGRREIGWRDGIRVGGAYLGRSPFTPILSLPADIAAKISMGGEEIAMETVPNGLAFPRGHYSGVATAQAGGQLHSILLVPKATEVPENRRLSFDRSRDIGEDQFHRETAPSSDAVLGIWPGERVETCGAMTDISEALYARTARGLAFVEALEIIRRGLPHAGFCPREWDILRTFADAGWFDLTLLRNFPARKLLQRPVTIRTIGVTTVAINGPTPLALIEHIEAAAEAAGATVEVHHGISEWSLPRLLVRTDDQTRQRDFIDRIGYAEQGRGAKAEPRKGEQNDAHGYHVVARFDDHRGCFATSSDGDMPHGLYRLERNEGKRPFLYRSVVAGMQAENFVSPSIAILEGAGWRDKLESALHRTEGRRGAIAEILSEVSGCVLSLIDERVTSESVLSQIDGLEKDFGTQAIGIASALAEGGLVPLYGMPTRSRNLYIDLVKKTGEREADWDTIDRDQDIAIFDFAPGNVRTREKLRHRCVGFTGVLKVPDEHKDDLNAAMDPYTHWKKDDFHLRFCEVCGTWSKGTEYTEYCEECGERLTDDPIHCVTPTAYRTDFRAKDEAIASKVGQLITLASLGDAIDSVEDKNLRVNFAENSEIYLVNPGSRSDDDPSGFEGYTVQDVEDGAAKTVFWFDKSPKLKLKRQAIDPTVIEEDAMRWRGGDVVTKAWLASPKITNSLQIGPVKLNPNLRLLDMDVSMNRRDPARTSVRAAAISATELIVQRAALELDIAPEEFDNLAPNIIRAGDGNPLPYLQIADSLPNGSGFCRHLLSSSKVPVTMLIRSILDEPDQWPRRAVALREHRERCETSCYKCLQRYNNRNFHGLLDWRLGLSYLRAFVDPAYCCGFDGKYEAFEIGDWRANALRLAEQTMTFIPGNEVSHVEGRPDIPIFTLDGRRSRWGVVVHPLWDQERLFSNLGLDQRFVAIDSFELARRPLNVLQRASNSW